MLYPHLSRPAADTAIGGIASRDFSIIPRQVVLMLQYGQKKLSDRRRLYRLSHVDPFHAA